MIQVREYATLTTDVNARQSLDCGVISEATFDWLLELAGHWKGDTPIALINNRRSLKLGSHVGYLQSPHGEAIEILPKTGLGQEEISDARQILQTMLKAVSGLSFREAGSADLLRMKMPLHEWIFSQFLGRLRELLAQGLRFDYEAVEEESRFIRGQLLLDRQQRQPPGRMHWFPIRHNLFTPHRIENRLLKTALEHVKSLCKHPENWRLANELSHHTAEIQPLHNPLQAFTQWHSSKLMQSYDAIRPWCELILEKLNPNFQHGHHQGISLLFPMEQLFEKYVAICLRKTIAPGATLKTQASSRYLVQHQPDNSGEIRNWFQLKPDLLLISGQKNQVLDTKWKLINQHAATTDTKYGISQSDLYQLFTYGQKYQEGHGHIMLVYPSHSQFEHPLPPFHFNDSLTLWAVPFELKQGHLITGDWKTHFPTLANDSKHFASFQKS